MSEISYPFSAAQRRRLDRYTDFLGSLYPTFNKIAVVFQLRRNRGHQLAVLAPDSRLGNARFNEQYLQDFWKKVEEARYKCHWYLDLLETFTRDSLAIAEFTSKNEPLSQVDFRWYSLSNLPAWLWFPPKNVGDMVHELALRAYSLNGHLRQLKYTIREVSVESFGVKDVFTRAMHHRSCYCHLQPIVGEELFRQSDTSPVWDISYSSRDAVVMAAEYTADIKALSNAVVSVTSQMEVFIEELYKRMDGVSQDLMRAKNSTGLRGLNSRLVGAVEGVRECVVMMNHLESWLRK